MDSLDTYLTIAENTTAEGIYKDKGSRFLAYTFYVETEDEVKKQLEILRKTYFDARHYCYAYLLGKDKKQFRANDDGEPNGTAGLPILNQIKSKNLTNVLVVVVRYFGGTKLGASGLVTAYKTAAQEALNNATIIEKIVEQDLHITFNYLQLNDVMKIIKDFNLTLKAQNFDNQCNISLTVRQNLLDLVKEKLSKITNLVLLILCVILMLGLNCYVAQAQNKFTNKQLQQHYDSIDKRSTNFPLLIATSNDAQLSSQITLPQELHNLTLLLQILQDSSSHVELRKNAIYAIGQIAEPSTAPVLVQQFDKETDIKVKETLLEAIGKTGYITDILEANFNDENLILAQLKGLYRAVTWKRNSTDKGTEKAVLALNHPNKEVRFWAASYLARNPKKNYTDSQIDTLLVKINTEKEAFVRMNIVSALSSAIQPHQTHVLNQLVEKSLKDPHQLVRINAIRALNRFDTTTTQKAMLKALQDNQANVAITASEFVRSHAQKDDKIDYLYWAEKLQHPQIRANILAVAIKFEKQEEVSAMVKKYFQKAPTVYEKGFLLNALTNNIKNFEFISQKIDVNITTPLNTFAFEATTQIRNHNTFEIGEEGKIRKEKFENLLVAILQGKDPVLIGLAATELRNEKRNYKNILPTALDALKKAKETLPIPLEIEAVIEIQKTIEFFEQQISENTSQPNSTTNSTASTQNTATNITKIGYNNPIDWQFVETLPESPQVKIKTNKGTIILALFTNEAPASVANFLKLIKQDFYTNKIFHRVVQNFVIQTGCPRGDGYGNVPFSIRSELANLQYGEGYLGMASAGKDTEGSQWFITHSPTPHLDGRYTIFGKVLSGMEVVNKIEIGDKIIKIEILP